MPRHPVRAFREWFQIASRPESADGGMHSSTGTDRHSFAKVHPKRLSVETRLEYSLSSSLSLSSLKALEGNKKEAERSPRL